MNANIMKEYTRLVDYVLDLENDENHSVFYMACLIDMIYSDDVPVHLLRSLRVRVQGSSLAPLADIADLLQINSGA